MPLNRRRWIWASRVVAVLAVIGLACYLALVGLEKADKVASVIGALAAVLALALSYLLPARTLGPSTPPAVDKHAPTLSSTEFESASLRIGSIPALASAFQIRADLRTRVDAARPAAVALVGGGGVGKSQFAASLADQAIRDGVDLVLWIAAAKGDSVVAAYARAATRVSAPGANGLNAEKDAVAFLDWLATTRRSWMVVLDDVDPDQMGSWWPVSHTASGRVLATTRRRDALLHGSGRIVIDVDVFSSDESIRYLTDRLHGAASSDLLDDQAEALAAAVGHLPLALSHATAYMLNENVTCSRYIALFTDQRSRIANLMRGDTDTDGYGRLVTVTLLLSVDAAQAAEPRGLALPALRIAAILDPAGHPDALWSDAAVIKYLGQQRSPGPDSDVPLTPGDARAAVRLLHRYGLVTHTPQAEPRALRIHALTGRAARESTPPAAFTDAVKAAADALLAVWPDIDVTSPELTETLRANTDALAGHAVDELWTQARDKLLHRSGTSLIRAGYYAAATEYFEGLAQASTTRLGLEHERTLEACAKLALAYQETGRLEDAVTLGRVVAADSERFLGVDHQLTIGAWVNLGFACWTAGHIEEGVRILEKGSNDSLRVLGLDDPATLASIGNLAFVYWSAGRIGEAISLEKLVAEWFERHLGANHPQTIQALENLAASYRQAGRLNEAILLGERAATSAVRVLGDEHPNTLEARAGLAITYWEVGRHDDAIAIEEDVAASRKRLLGETHPDTLQALKNLAISYQGIDRVDDALRILEKIVTDAEQVLGSTHPETLQIRGALAFAYRITGRMEDALRMTEDVVALSTALYGSDHLNTLQARTNLLNCHIAEKSASAMSLSMGIFEDSMQVLGADHPHTVMALANVCLAAIAAGDLNGATAVAKRALAESQRVLGEDHPHTETARLNLSLLDQHASNKENRV